MEEKKTTTPNKAQIESKAIEMFFQDQSQKGFKTQAIVEVSPGANSWGLAVRLVITGASLAAPPQAAPVSMAKTIKTKATHRVHLCGSIAPPDSF